MPAYPRAELEEMVERWLEANRAGEAKQDWRHMADLYTEDATYGWNVGPNDEFMAVGREEIREIALGLEMAGPRGVDLPVPEGADRRAAGRGPRPVEAGGRRHEGRRHQLRDRRPGRQLVPLRRELPVVAGSATSSTSATPAPSSWR